MAFDMVATTGGYPNATRVGNVMSVPDPTTALMAPAPKPARRMTMISVTGTDPRLRKRLGAACRGHVPWVDVTLAQDERAELVLTLTAVGESAPTLCGEWTARDLAAHLVVRERRLDASPGILLPVFAGYTEKVQATVATRPYDELVADVAGGPPLWSPFRLLDPFVNVGEMFVHHEDLRRARPGWTPRMLSVDLQNKLWSTAGLVGRLAFRGSPVGVELATPDGRTVTVKKAGGRSVVLTGRPSELLLYAFGRSEVEIDASGEPEDIDAVGKLDRSF